MWFEGGKGGGGVFVKGNALVLQWGFLWTTVITI